MLTSFWIYDSHITQAPCLFQEHDLRKAIEAQKKFVGIGNDHLIPTRQVLAVDPEEYALICKWKSDQKPINYASIARGLLPLLFIMPIYMFRRLHLLRRGYKL